MTTYSKEERKQIADAFRHALKNLPSRDNPKRQKLRFICWYLTDKGLAGGEAARAIISQRLGLCSFYTGWLEHAGIPYQDILDDRANGSPKAQAGRKAWLKSLIKEFSK